MTNATTDNLGIRTVIDSDDDINNNNNNNAKSVDQHTKQIWLPQRNVKWFFYNIWCFLCIYTLAAIYSVIELRRKYQRMRQGNSALALDDHKDQLRHLDQMSPNWVSLVTGGDRGIGWDCTKTLLARNSRVIVAGICPHGCDERKVLESLRNELADEEQQELLDFWFLDLSSMQSVYKFVQRFQKTGLHLNTLINNAGIMMAPFSVTEDGFERHLAVNFLGHCLLTLHLLPQLQLAAQRSGVRSRVVNVSSSTHYCRPIFVEELNKVDQIQDYQFSSFHAYPQSKSFIIAFSFQLAQKYKFIDVFTLHPGVANSQLYEHVWLAKKFPIVKKILLRTPADAAVNLVYAALSKRLDGESGIYLEDKKSYTPNRLILDVSLQEQVYNQTLKLLKSWLPGEML